MSYNNVIEVHFNWHKHPDHGSDFGYYRVDERYDRFRGGSVRCEEIKIDFDEGMHAIIYFEDGTVEYQWNLNKIIEAELYGNDFDRKHQSGEEPSELPKPSAS